MPAPRVYRTEALVLKAFDFGEADRILTLFTPGRGKIRAIAKGTRRTKSRMAGHLDLFTRSTILVASGRQLDIVTQAETIEHFPLLRDDLRRLAHAHYVAELLDGFLPDALVNYPAYALAIVTLRRLSTLPESDLAVRAFEIQLLTLTGYRPQLYRCLHCESPIEPKTNFFSVSMGGVLCPSCHQIDRTAASISVPALKLLRNLQTNEERTLALPGVAEEVSREVERRLQEYIVYRLEARPRSVGFIERLRAEAARA